jgi:hypothetical protein
MTDFIKILTQDQMVELKTLRDTHKGLLPQLQKTFEKEAKYYGNNIYGIYGIFSNDPFNLNCVYQYQYLKGLTELMSK